MAICDDCPMSREDLELAASNALRTRITRAVNEKLVTYQDLSLLLTKRNKSYVSQFVNGKGGNPPSPRILESWKRDILNAALDKAEKSPKSARASLVGSFDPDSEDRETFEGATIGRITGVRGIPADASPQVEVTGGMGGGGLTIVADGIPAGNGLTFSAEHIRDYWRLPSELLHALRIRAPEVAVIPVQGDSMFPTLNEGDYVFIDTRHRVPSPAGLYAVLDEVGGLVVKRIEVSSDPGAAEQTIRVISDNPRHGYRDWRADELFIVGRVLKKFSNVV